MDTSAGITFADLLVSVTPRERSGARTSNRFSFQQSWGLCLVLQLHAKPDDYCVLFDVHEDIVALDSPTVPTCAEVYQVKSDTMKQWTIASLTKRGKDKDTKVEKSSILGKLYKNYVQFPGCIKSMSFVTNAPFSLKLADRSSCNDHDSICVDKIEAIERATVCAKIAAEHLVEDPPAGLASTFLVRTPLSVTDHERHTEGIVSDFLQKQGDGTIAPAPFHRTLRSELRRRNDKESSVNTFSDLAKLKGISRGDLQRMLDSIPSDRRMTELRALVRNQLIKEGANVRHQARLNADVQSYLVKRLDVTNTLVAAARLRAAQEVLSLSEDHFTTNTPINDTIAHLSNVLSPEFDAIRRMYSDTFLQAIIAVAIYEQHEFPTFGTQSTEETT